jgi:hypothetical protein
MEYSELRKAVAALNISGPRLAQLHDMFEVSGDAMSDAEVIRLCVLGATDSANREAIADWYVRWCRRGGAPIVVK